MGRQGGLGQTQRTGKAAALLGGMIGSVIGFGLWATAATAAQLQFWRFDPIQNRLEFTTDEMIQPRVRLIPNPVRLVVDLPGVQLGRPTLNQSYNAAVRSVRIGQVDAQTARIVVELATGYSVDPQQVKVNATPNGGWSIDLPTPQFVQVAPEGPGIDPPDIPNSNPLPPPAPRPAPLPPPSSAATVTPQGNNAILEDVLITRDGLLFKTREAVLGAQVTRSRNRREVAVDLRGVVLSSVLARNEYRLDYHGIKRISVRQLSMQPPTARVTLRVERNGPDWAANVNQAGGVLVLPLGGAGAIPNTNRPTATLSLTQGRPVATTVPSPLPNSSSSPASNPTFSGDRPLTTLQTIALGGSQLLIQADRPLYYTTGWQGTQYRIFIRDAQWSPNLRTPQLGFGSPLSDISIRQEGQNAILLVTPAVGVRFGSISRSGSQGVVLNFNRLGSGSTASPFPSIFQPNPTPPFSGQAQPTLPRPIGRRLVVIDPGHGGSDVGAVGIGGLRETDIVLPIGLEVARLLQQQGLEVRITRTDESREVDLPPRAALANRLRADVFVSIHANAINMSRPDINGTEVYYAPGSASGAELSQIILNSIVRNVNMRNRGVRAARFYVIRNTSMPATLVETGFVTGAEDAPRLRDPSFQRQMAAAIAQGIIEFLNRR